MESKWSLPTNNTYLECFVFCFFCLNGLTVKMAFFKRTADTACTHTVQVKKNSDIKKITQKS